MFKMAGMTMVAASLALAACDQNPAGNAPESGVEGTPMANEKVPPPEPAAASLSRQDFADTVAASDAFEVASARLATEKASTPEVKAYAQKMIQAHNTSTEKLKKEAAALTPAIKPDPALSLEQQKKLDELGKLSGAEFERVYVVDQIAAHEKALEMVQAYSADGDEPKLKTFATDAMKMVSDHLDEARKLGASGAKVANP